MRLTLEKFNILSIIAQVQYCTFAFLGITLGDIDWKKTLADWKGSEKSFRITQPKRVDEISQLCEHVGCNFKEGNIVPFSSDVKQALDNDDLGRCEVFEIAAGQILEHRLVHQAIQREHPKRLTYEFPIAIKDDPKLKYMKFQLVEGCQKGITSPEIVKTVWVDYHNSKQNIEVVYNDDDNS